MTVDARWAQLPPSLGPVLAADLDDLSKEVVAAVRTEVPLYDRPMEGSFGRGILLGVHEALRQFCLLVESRGRGDTGGLAVYEELGRGEWRHGRPLDALLAAYRVGARIAWRRFALLTADAGLGTHELVVLAELVFAHIDGLSAASADGYAAEQAEQAGERDRRRLALLRLLLANPVDVESATAAARLAAWAVPSRIQVVVAPAGTRLGFLLGADALFEDADPALALIAAPGAGAPLRRLLGLLDGTGAVVGPARGPDGGAASRDRAAALLALREQGRLEVPAGEAVHTEDHLTRLVIWADPAAATDLARGVLERLDDLSPATRDRLVETLRAWLVHGGERAAVAEQLHVHPQTVRYRLAQLRALLGERVDDPASRLGLLLAAEILTAPGYDATVPTAPDDDQGEDRGEPRAGEPL